MDRTRLKYGAVFSPALGAILALALVAFPVNSCASCHPDVYYLFGADARAELERINRRPTGDSCFKRLVLWHNLAFEKDSQAREEAEQLLEEHFPPEERTPLVKGYAGSLAMIRVSHWSRGSKIARTVSPFNRSPRLQAVEGFQAISEAVAEDPANPILRLLRSTAGAESVEHLPEFFDETREDLEWLTDHQNRTDPVLVFINELNWAKYFYKLAGEEARPHFMRQARQHLDRANPHACTPVYQQWLKTWRERIDARGAKGKK